MAEPSPKRLRKSGLPSCAAHRRGRALPGQLARQNFPPAVEESLCGVASALLEAAYVFQLLLPLTAAQKTLSSHASFAAAAFDARG
ncbi:UNVERIFIED_CONTAM: hypothetical protein K2H54_059988 [Gekko kuhli]